jgi:hypothetical protein
MEISNTGSVVTITGNIKSIGNLQTIKICLDNMIQDNTSITLKILDSISITSSVIGYLTKLVYKDNLHINMDVGDERLYDLLDELSLVSLFNVKRS